MSGEYQPYRVIPVMQTDRPDDDFAVVSELNIRLRRNGAMSVEGFTGDRDHALAMLANAREAILRNSKPSGSLVVPGHDVAVPEFAP